MQFASLALSAMPLSSVQRQQYFPDDVPELSQLWSLVCSGFSQSSVNGVVWTCPLPRQTSLLQK